MKPHGYYPEKYTPGLWIHNELKIAFTLVVDDFSIKHNNNEDLQYLINMLSTRHIITKDMSGSLHVGVTLQWDYENRKVRYSMLNYIPKLIKKYNHLITGNTQYS